MVTSLCWSLTINHFVRFSGRCTNLGWSENATLGFAAGSISVSIQHITGKQNVCADCMSRLPVFAKRHPVEKIQAIMEVDTLPVTDKQSARDSMLGLVLQAVQHVGWPQVVSKELMPFHIRCTELTINEGCLLWRCRVVIPQKLRNSLLSELHSNHIGVNKTKSLAKSYVWWLNTDTDIEAITKTCETFLLNANSPAPAPLHLWMVLKQPWEQVHIDHAFWRNKVMLVAIDVYSKWSEVHVINSTSVKQTTKKLQSVFAFHRSPVILVSDNDSPFQSEEFKSFVEANGILHRRVPPYHPASNGAAENMVKLVKKSLEKNKTSDSLQTKITKFLSSYRNTPHTVTGRTPAEVLLGRAPHTRLFLVHPCLFNTLSARAEMKVGSTPLRNFDEGQEVLICHHHSDTKLKWRRAKILARPGPLTYEVSIGGQTRMAYVDHLMPSSLEEDEAIEYEQSTKRRDLTTQSVQLKLRHLHINLLEVQIKSRTLNSDCFLSFVFVN